MDGGALFLPILAAGAAGVLLCVRAWRAVPLPAERSGRRDFARGEESGRVMLDFILTFPLFLMILLVVIQFALMANARLVVSWAAFAAARSSVVATEGGVESAEMSARDAAVVACTAISPAPDLFGRVGPGSGPTVPHPAAALLVLHGGETGLLPGSETWRRGWRVGAKYRYADAATEVEVTTRENREEIGPHDPVKVTVTHWFHLAVPYADGLFSRALGEWRAGGPTVPIRETVTLTNEGKVRTEALVEEKGKCRSFSLSPAALLDWIRGG